MFSEPGHSFGAKRNDLAPPGTVARGSPSVVNMPPEDGLPLDSVGSLGLACGNPDRMNRAATATTAHMLRQRTDAGLFGLAKLRSRDRVGPHFSVFRVTIEAERGPDERTSSRFVDVRIAHHVNVLLTFCRAMARTVILGVVAVEADRWWIEG
jgi:hypothetical protein